MFFRQLRAPIELTLPVPQHAEELFLLVDRNRAFLQRWLPWIEASTRVEDTRSFLEQQLQGFAQGRSFTGIVCYEGAVAGVAGFNTINRANGEGVIGYWLGEEFTGKGVMTCVVEDLITIGRDYYALQRIEIRCAPENLRSRAIPQRLGFQHEGTLRRAERMLHDWHDLEVHALLL